MGIFDFFKKKKVIKEETSQEPKSSKKEKKMEVNDMKINIDELGLKNISFSDLLGGYNKDQISEIKEQLLSEEYYQGDLMEFYKDEESDVIKCELIYGDFELIDHLNLMAIFKDDPLVMIVKDSWIGENLDGDEIAYVSFETYNCDEHPQTLKGGQHGKKIFMNEEELAEFDELSENENISYDDVKYQEFHFIRASIYDPKKWIQKWLDQDYGHNN